MCVVWSIQTLFESVSLIEVVNYIDILCKYSYQVYDDISCIEVSSRVESWCHNVLICYGEFAVVDKF